MSVSFSGVRLAITGATTNDQQSMSAPPDVIEERRLMSQREGIHVAHAFKLRKPVSKSTFLELEHPVQNYEV